MSNDFSGYGDPAPVLHFDEHVTEKLADACRRLVRAYERGAANGGSVDWDDLDDAHGAALGALDALDYYNDGAHAGPETLDPERVSAGRLAVRCFAAYGGHHDGAGVDPGAFVRLVADILTYHAYLGRQTPGVYGPDGRTARGLLSAALEIYERQTAPSAEGES